MREELTWAELLTTESFKDLPPGLPQPSRLLSAVQLPFDERGRLDARSVIAALAKERDPGCTLVLIDEELCAGPFEYVFGYANRRQHMSVVSASRLRDPLDQARILRRIGNVASHELGHLNGLRHCRAAGCLMHPAPSVADVDRRSLSLCDRCIRRSSVFRGTIALAGCLLLFAVTDRCVQLLPELEPSSPFTVRATAQDSRSQLLFNGRQVLASTTLRDHGSQVVNILNATYRQVEAPNVESTSAGPAVARVLLNGAPLLEVKAGDAGALAPEAAARQWAQSLSQLLDAKGTSGQVCAECHINRYNQVLVWSRAHTR
jgi:predicted Zn-dependent protease